MEFKDARLFPFANIMSKPKFYNVAHETAAHNRSNFLRVKLPRFTQLITSNPLPAASWY